MLFNKKEELNVLINLAAIDKVMDAKEVNLIKMIGKASGIADEEMSEMIKHPQIITSLRFMTEEEKFEHLYYLIRLMKADGKVLRDEINFCQKIAVRLGYDKGVIGALSQHIYSDLQIQSERDLLRKKVDQFKIN